MNLRELRTGDYFRFEGKEGVYQYRGNGWYDSGPYTGRPARPTTRWHSYGGRVFLVSLEEEANYRLLAHSRPLAKAQAAAEQYVGGAK